MSIFTKPLSQLTTDDLQELLTDGAVENARLEFKLEVPSKDETLKKLSSFANTFGGFMVVGAKAKSADGRIEDLPGVDVVNGYKQKVVQWSFDGASPPLTVEVSDPIPAPAANGKVCYVIYTGESDVAPHFLNGRKGVYVRIDEFSARFEARMADERELRQLFDRRKLIQERRAALLERARRRFETYSIIKRTTLATHPSEFGARLELCLVPRFPARPLCEQGKLMALIMENYLPWRGIRFPNLSGSIVSQHESAIVLEPVVDLSLFEANIWGMLFYCTKIADANSIHLYGFVGYLVLFLRHAEKVLRALGYAGPIYIETTLASMRGIPWLLHEQGLVPTAGSELDNDVAFSITTTSEELCEKPDDIAMDILRYVFFSVNWPDLIDTPKKLEELVLRGYKFNYWKE
jgi:hypothetical protein